MKLKFSVITDIHGILEIKDQWNTLVKSTDVDHAFMRHEWFECWIKHLKPDGKIMVHTAWDNDRLVAIAPLQIVKEKRKKIPLRILSFLRSSVTPRSNFIIDDAVDSSLFFDTVLSTRGWDVAELRAMEIGAPTTGKLVSYLSKTKNFVQEDGIQSPYEMLNTDWESYLKSKSTNYRKNYRNCFNRLKKEGDYRIIKVEDSEELEKHFEALIEVSSRSWKASGKTDLRSMPQMANFYRDFSELASKNSLFVVYILMLKDRIAAFAYYLRHKNRLVGIRWEYDESYSYFMPGLALHNHCLKDIIDTQEAWEYDLSGMITEHKGKLVQNVRKHVDLTIGRPGFVGDVMIFFKKQFLKGRPTESLDK